MIEDAASAFNAALTKALADLSLGGVAPRGSLDDDGFTTFQWQNGEYGLLLILSPVRLGVRSDQGAGQAVCAGHPPEGGRGMTTKIVAYIGEALVCVALVVVASIVPPIVAVISGAVGLILLLGAYAFRDDWP